MSPPRRYTLSLSCPDRVGVVAAVSSFLAGHEGWITEANHHADVDGKRFFMRQEILADSLPFDIDVLREKFAPIAREFDMDWKISDSARKKRVVVMVSKQEHCLYDLLSRWHADELNIEIPCVISNHETFRGLVEWHGIPFHHVPVTPETKAEAYASVEDLYREARGDVMVLPLRDLGARSGPDHRAGRDPHRPLGRTGRSGALRQGHRESGPRPRPALPPGRPGAGAWQ
jgi:formyltetrahydrofolate deformylase